MVCGLSARELTKNVCTQGPSGQFSARARFLARALEKKCVHISAQQESYSGTKCEQGLSRVFIGYKDTH